MLNEPDSFVSKLDLLGQDSQDDEDEPPKKKKKSAAKKSKTDQVETSEEPKPEVVSSVAKPAFESVDDTGPTEEEDEDTRRKKAKIREYKRQFEGFDYITFEHIAQLQGEELDRQLNDIRHAVSAKSTAGMERFMFQTGAGFVETLLIDYTPIRAQGFSKKLFDNPGLAEVYKEITIESNKFEYRPPAERALYIAMVVLMETHKENKNPESKETAEMLKGESDYPDEIEKILE